MTWRKGLRTPSYAQPVDNLKERVDRLPSWAKWVLILAGLFLFLEQHFFSREQSILMGAIPLEYFGLACVPIGVLLLVVSTVRKKDGRPPQR